MLWGCLPSGDPLEHATERGGTPLQSIEEGVREGREREREEWREGRERDGGREGEMERKGRREREREGGREGLSQFKLYCVGMYVHMHE